MYSPIFPPCRWTGSVPSRQGGRVSYDLVQGPKGDLAQNIRPVLDDGRVVEPAATEPATALTP